MADSEKLTAAELQARTAEIQSQYERFRIDFDILMLAVCERLPAKEIARRLNVPAKRVRSMVRGDLQPTIAEVRARMEKLLLDSAILCLAEKGVAAGEIATQLDISIRRVRSALG